MVQLAVGKNIPLYADSTAPGVKEIKVVQGVALELDDCDSVAGFSNVSGSPTPTISLENSIVDEGTGAAKITFTATGVYVIKTSFGAQSLASYPRVTFSVRRSIGLRTLGGQIKVSITDDGGERGPDTYTTFSGTGYASRSFDLSSFTSAEKDSVTEVKFTINVTSLAGASGDVFIDYIFADPGYGNVQAGLDDRTAILSVPYLGTFTATATDPRTITFPRSDVVKSVLIAGDTASAGAYWGTADMAGKAKLLSATAVLASGQITEMGAGYFIVSGNCNINGVTYFYEVKFADEA